MRRLRRGAPALALVLGLAGAQPALAAGEISVVVNGEPVAFDDVGPRMVDGRVLVPLRRVLEAMGAEVQYHGDTATIVVRRGGTTVELVVGETEARVDGRPVTLDVPPQVSDGRTLIPLRFVSEALGAEVGWEPISRRVTIAAGATLSAEQRALLQDAVTWARETTRYTATGPFQALVEEPDTARMSESIIDIRYADGDYYKEVSYETGGVDRIWVLDGTLYGLKESAGSSTYVEAPYDRNVNILSKIAEMLEGALAGDLEASFDGDGRVVLRGNIVYTLIADRLTGFDAERVGYELQLDLGPGGRIVDMLLVIRAGRGDVTLSVVYLLTFQPADEVTLPPLPEQARRQES